MFKKRVVMSNDELQKAIDDITSGGNGSVSEDSGSASVELPVEMGGTPGSVMPEVGAMPDISQTTESQGADELPIAPAPNPSFSEAGTFSFPGMSTTPAPVSEPVSSPIVSPAPAPVQVPVSSSSNSGMVQSGDADILQIKNDALIELYPMLDTLTIDAERKFEICMLVFENRQDKGALSKALKSAKEIADTNKKANALMRIIDKTENM